MNYRLRKLWITCKGFFRWLGLCAGILLFIYSCTSTSGTTTLEKKLSSDSKVILFTLQKRNNPFLTRDISFSIDDLPGSSAQRIYAVITLDDIQSGYVVDETTEFTVNFDLPQKASIIFSGKVIKNQSLLTLRLARSYFEGNTLPISVVAEDNKTLTRYSVETFFTPPTLNFRYRQTKHTIKLEQRNYSIRPPQINGTASGVTQILIKPKDSLVQLNPNGSLSVMPENFEGDERTRKYLIKIQRQGTSVIRRLNFQFYNNSQPSAPQIISPDNFALDVPRYEDTLLTWLESEDEDNDPINYRVTIALSREALAVNNSILQQRYAEDIVLDTVTSKSYYQLPSSMLTPKTQYFWYVEAHDGFSQKKSIIQNFTSANNSPPSQFSLLSPEDKAEESFSETLNFSWMPSDDANNDAISYNIYLSIDENKLFLEGRSAALAITAIGENLKAPSFSFNKKLAPFTTYYWRVKASDGFDDTLSDVYSFKAGGANAVSPLEIVEPLNNSKDRIATNPVSLTWRRLPLSNDENILLYNIYFSTNAEAVILEDTSALITPDSLHNNIFIIDAQKLFARSTYFWKVTAKELRQSESTEVILENYVSPVFSFSTKNQAPTSPLLASPLNNSRGVGRINDMLFSWEASSDPDQDEILYNLYVSQNEEDLFFKKEDFLVASNISRLSYFYPKSNLDPISSYYWMIASSDGLAENTSKIRNFSTGKNIPPKPVRLNPIGNKTNNKNLSYNKGVSLSWGGAFYEEGDEFYYLQLAESPQDLAQSNFVYRSQPISEKQYTIPPEVMFPKKEYFASILVEDRFKTYSFSDIQSFTTRGARISFSANIVTPENLEDFSMAIHFDSAPEKNISYQYTINDSSTRSPPVTAKGIASSQRTEVSLDLLNQGRGSLSLEINFEDSEGTLFQNIQQEIQQENFIKIGSYSQLTSINSSSAYPLQGTYVIVRDLSAAAQPNHSPIGSQTAPFTGRLYGLGKSLTGLTIQRSTQSNVGLFAAIKDATIDNFSITSSEKGITGKTIVGSLAGRILGDSKISNFSFSGLVKADSKSSDDAEVGYQIGGFAGRVSGKVSLINIRSAGAVIGTDNIGGLIGRAYSGVSLLGGYSTSRVSGENDVGGLVGRGIDIELRNSIAQNVITGHDKLGGIIGSLIQGSLFNCSWLGEVNGIQEVGGTVGWLSQSRIVNSFVSGQTSYIKGSSNIGGLVGYALNKSIIQDSYTRQVKVEGDNHVGGLIGLVTKNTRIKNSYANSQILPTPRAKKQAAGTANQKLNFGGIVGKLDSSVQLENSFYNNDLLTAVQNANIILTENKNQKNTSVSSLLGRKTSELKQLTTFKDWDFENVWDIRNNGYPFLKQNN